MKTLIAIMAHASVVDVFERHMPFWLENQKEGAELLLIFPQGESIKGTGIPALEVGKAQHDGSIAIRRFRTILEHAAGLGHDLFFFMEYDSFILGKLPTTKLELAGNIFYDDSAAWLGKSFIHPPFMVDAHALRRIVEAFNRMPMDVEKGMWDRALGLATEEALVMRESWIASGYGYSQNTIHPADHPDLRKAILNGCHAIHGAKDEPTLKVIQEAWKTRHAIEDLEGQGYKVTAA